MFLNSSYIHYITTSISICLVHRFWNFVMDLEKIFLKNIIYVPWIETWCWQLFWLWHALGIDDKFQMKLVWNSVVEPLQLWKTILKLVVVWFHFLHLKRPTYNSCSLMNIHPRNYIFVPFLLVCHFPLGGKLVWKLELNDEILKNTISKFLTRVVMTLWFWLDLICEVNYI